MYSKRLRRLLKRIGYKRQKRIVFILGAGAVNIWENGADTKLINKKLSESGLYKSLKDNNKTIFSLIFEYLESYYHNKDSINFETVLAVIEELYNYYYNLSQTALNPNDFSFNPLIFSINSDFIDIWDLTTTKEAYKDVTTDANTLMSYYFQGLFTYYLDEIVRLIEKYDCDTNVDNSHGLADMLDYFKNNNTILRFYTTNYDRILLKILNKKYSTFDGFSDNNTLTTETFSVNHSKIINDDYCLNYYNLHGSVYWTSSFDVDMSENKTVCNPNYLFPNDLNRNNPTTNPGEKILFSNIVTGYNKLQRISLSPLDLFFYSFQRDCINADTIVFVGYSWNDNHLNHVIFNSYRNSSPRLINITFLDSPSIPDTLRDALCFNVIGNDKYDFFKYSHDNDWILSENKNQLIYWAGIKKFLNDKSNWRKIIK